MPSAESVPPSEVGIPDLGRHGSQDGGLYRSLRTDRVGEPDERRRDCHMMLDERRDQATGLGAAWRQAHQRRVAARGAAGVRFLIWIQRGVDLKSVLEIVDAGI